MAKDQKSTDPEPATEPTQEDVDAAIAAHNAEVARKAKEGAKTPPAEPAAS